jgi:hypothetical protein
MIMRNDVMRENHYPCKEENISLYFNCLPQYY